MEKKVLIVVTSNDQLGDSDEKTGWYLSEVSHIYYTLKDAGFEIQLASPQGGMAPLDPTSCDLDDEENKRFVKDFKIQDGLSTKSLSDMNSKDFGVMYFAGGHGTMGDFPESEDINNLASSIYEDGGIIAAVCHGPAALVNLKLSDGSYLIEGKKVNSFTDSEEREMKKEDAVPFLLESKLKERGANFEGGKNWEDKVVVDGRLITGQNPQSAASLGKKIVEVFNNLKNEDQLSQKGTTSKDFQQGELR